MQRPTILTSGQGLGVRAPMGDLFFEDDVLARITAEFSGPSARTSPLLSIDSKILLAKMHKRGAVVQAMGRFYLAKGPSVRTEVSAPAGAVLCCRCSVSASAPHQAPTSTGPPRPTAAASAAASADATVSMTPEAVATVASVSGAIETVNIIPSLGSMGPLEEIVERWNRAKLEFPSLQAPVLIRKLGSSVVRRSVPGLSDKVWRKNSKRAFLRLRALVDEIAAHSEGCCDLEGKGSDQEWAAACDRIRTKFALPKTVKGSKVHELIARLKRSRVGSGSTSN